MQPLKAGLERNRDGKVWVNVKDFGAKGDGVTLNKNAVQRAIDQVKNGGGGTVFFPNGTYLCANLRLYPGVTLLGESTAGAVIKRAVESGYVNPLINTYNTYSSAAWSGTNSNATAGDVVTDSSKNFTGLVGLTVYNATDNFSSGTITSAGKGAFTAALSGGAANRWRRNDHYDIGVDSAPLCLKSLTLDGNWSQQTGQRNEFAGLLALDADARYAGRLTVSLQDLKVQNNNGADGLYVQNNVNLTANNITGAHVGRGTITVCEGYDNVNVNGLTSDGWGNLFSYEVDADGVGYSQGRYRNSIYTYAHAPNNVTITNMTQAGKATSYISEYSGCYSTFTFNHLMINNNLVPTIDLEATNTLTIENSTIHTGTNYAGYTCCMGVGNGGTLNLINDVLQGQDPPRGAIHSYNQPYSMIVEELNNRGGANTPSAIYATNCTFDVDTGIPTSYGGVWLLNVAGSWSAPNSITLKGCTVSSNITDIAYSSQSTSIIGGTYNNTGYLLNDSNNSGSYSGSLTVNGPIINNASGFFKIGALSSFAVTQSNLTMPAASATCYCGVVPTVSGRKTIVGTANPPPSTQNAWGDDKLGAGNGDYYQNAASNPTKQWRCTVSGWNAGGTHHPSAWVATIP